MRKTRAKIAAICLSAAMAAGLLSGPCMLPAYAEEMTEGTTYEFEDGETKNGPLIERDEVNNVGYVDLHNAGEQVTVKATVPQKGMYNLSIRYLLEPGRGASKTQHILINGKTAGDVTFKACEDWTSLDIGEYLLQEGENTITIESYWGWTKFDHVTVTPASLPQLQGKNTLCDAKATSETQGLMNYLADMYGNHVLTGQQEACGGTDEGEFEYILEKTGKQPAIRAFDYLNYNPCFYYKDKTTERIIDWVNNKGGIATTSFHWFCPAKMENYKLGDRVEWKDSSFYINGAGNPTTDFDVTKVQDETSVEYQYVMLSLEKIAEEFQILQDAGVPIIFRPLHEAGGSGTEDCSGEWFWWAGKGPEAYKYLWKLVYKTLTEKYNLHNIIWEFNAYTYDGAEKWYPGDEYVDIVAYDKYNASYATGPNESAVSATFYNLVKRYGDKKMVAMAECDTIPNVENLVDESAYWLYACPWYGEHLKNAQMNNPETLNKIYNSDLFITLDELPEYKTYKSTAQTPDQTDDQQKPSKDEQTPSKDEGKPSEKPSQEPSKDETKPSEKPSQEPSKDEGKPSQRPSQEPSKAEAKPSEKPSQEPSKAETNPSEEPSQEPSKAETKPSEEPSQEPSKAETKPSEEPSQEPSKEEPQKPSGDDQTHTHTFQDKVVEATTDKDGYTEHTCISCGYVYRDNFTPAKKGEHATHDYNYKVAITKAATCTEPGEKTCTCSCGETRTEEIPATGHTYQQIVIPATASEQGYTLHICTKCGDTKKDNYTDYNGDANTKPDTSHTHSFTKTIVEIPATCENSGIQVKICDCGQVDYQTFSAIGHDWKTTLKTATLNRDGEQSQICTHCGLENTQEGATETIPQIKSIYLSNASYIYSGKAKRPEVTVEDREGSILTEGDDYTVTYLDSGKNVGQHAVKVAFKGNYSGSATKKFLINPKGTSLSSLTVAKKSLKVKWKKQSSQVDGFQIQYGTSKKFSGAKTVYVSKSAATSATIKKLSAKKTYYVRIRSYKKASVDGSSKKLYSKWSNVKSKKTK